MYNDIIMIDKLYSIQHIQLHPLCFNYCSVSCSLKLKDLEEVGRVVSRKLISGKRSLMLIDRDCVLEDTLHYMSKEGFNPAYPITVS